MFGGVLVWEVRQIAIYIDSVVDAKFIRGLCLNLAAAGGLGEARQLQEGDIAGGIFENTACTA